MPTPNRLANEASPYLKSAAEQPVDWHPWGEEAFAKAQREDKPVLLDIGAVWCHWCHVIDHESYDDAEVARIINENFVPVKVDRDERPDVDRRYQEAVGAISGQGGWPLTGFLTPDGKVFYGGTYFPKEDMYGRPGFKSVLQQVAQFYRTRKDTALSQAQQLYDAVKQGMAGRAQPGRINAGMIDEVVRQCTRAFDARHGGFGTQPKFPHTGAMELLSNRLYERDDATTRQIIDTTLTCMGKGGVYDQIGDGFHRYSTDQKWIVPHFEKMSYDNSELLRNYIDAWQLTGNEFYREIAEGIIRWTNEVLSDQERGGFYASQDADIDLTDDGDFFTWTVDEAKAALSADEFRVLGLHYDIHEQGEMHHNPAKNVLHCAIELPAVAKLIDRTEDEVRALLASGKRKLGEARRQRPTPFVDTTIYTNWNAMYIAAYLRAWKGFRGQGSPTERSAQAGFSNGDIEQLKSFALKTTNRIIDESWSEEHGFAHLLTPEPRTLNPLADDQMQMSWALLEAHEVTGDERYLDFARKAVGIALRKFWDETNGGFFDCESDDNALGMLGARYKSIQDSPNPSTNGVAGLVLARLHYVTAEDRYRELCEKLLNAFAEPALQAGLYASTYFLALEYFLKKPAQVVVVGERDNRKTSELMDAAFETFRPRKLVMSVAASEVDGALSSRPFGLPSTVKDAVRGWLRSRTRPTEAFALVCAGEACANPTSDPDELTNLIRTFGVAR